MSSFALQSSFPIASFSPAYVKTLAGDTYLYDSGLYPCPFAAPIQCCFIQNDDPLRDMVVWAFVTSHNGGNVTNTKRKTFFGRFGMTLPTMNNNPVFLAATNGSNLVPAPATAFVTGSLAGLDNGALTGFIPTTNIIAPEQSSQLLDFPGGVRIPPGGNVGCSCVMDAEDASCSEQFLVSWVQPNSL